MSDTRGQAFTLEGLVGSIIVLTALLFALESIIVTPTTPGTIDPTTRTELRQQADDVLVTAARAEENDLSTLARNWSQSKRTFAGGLNPRIGYGPKQPPGPFGVLLNQTFSERSHLYNVEMHYQPKNTSNDPGVIPVVYRGTPSDGAVVASYTLTLYDNQTLTAPNATRNVNLWEYDTNATDGDDGYYPIPNAIDGPVYNVVEVRIIVW